MNTGETYTIFDAATRLPVTCVTCARESLAAHVKEGQIAVEGRFDCSRTRLNDSDEPELDEVRVASNESERRRAARQMRIEELERKQARRVRELLAETDPQLKLIDQEIAALRAEL